MDTSALGKKLARFGLYEADLQQRVLTKGGLRVRLQEQPFQVLALLLQNSGEIVSREDIRQKLWSADTYVEFDDGLNTAIKKLRLALGDAADNPRFIETIPRRGYRFVAPVSFPAPVPAPVEVPQPLDSAKSVDFLLPIATAQPSEIASDHVAAIAPEPPLETPSRSRLLWGAVALLVTLAAGIGGYFYKYGRTSTPENDASVASASNYAIKPRPSVAVLGFRNVSRSADEAWISTALSEMLNTELAAGERLRLVPGEQIAHTELNLSSAEMESLAKDSLQRVRAGVGADFVVLGSYTAVGQPGKRRIRLDLRLQDTRAGETVGEDAVTGTEDNFFDLVSEAGVRLRQRFDAGALASDQAVQVRASLPSNVKAARLYAEGVAKLRISESLAARDLLLQAITADPKFPMTHSALAAAWSDLGYDNKAQQEAKLAFDLSTHESSQERLLAEGRYRESVHDWPKAMEIYRSLSQTFPDNVDYGLRLAAVQTVASQGKDALATLNSLRNLRFGAGTDPRIDLQEAKTSERLGDFKHAQLAAAAAATKGRAQQMRFVVAQARSAEGWDWDRLGQFDKAEEALSEAKTLFAATRDHHSTATTINLIGDLLYDKGDFDSARKTLNESLAMCRQYGFQQCAARSLNAMGHIQSEQGELLQARTSYEAALRINRETGFTVGVASALGNLANVEDELGNLDSARKQQEEALRAFTELNDKRGMGSTFGNLGNLLDEQGDLAGAIHCFEQAYALHQATGHKRGSGYVLSSWGSVLLEQGHLPEARAKLEQSLAIRKELGNPETIANSTLLLGQLALEDNRPAEAEQQARTAAGQFAIVKAVDEEATANAILARALLEQHKLPEARAAADHAVALARKTAYLPPRLEAGIASALVQAAEGKPAEARKQLDAFLAQSKKLGFVGYEFEARLDLGRISGQTGQVALGHAQLASLEKDARAKGYLLIASKGEKGAR